MALNKWHNMGYFCLWGGGGRITFAPTKTSCNAETQLSTLQTAVCFTLQWSQAGAATYLKKSLRSPRFRCVHGIPTGKVWLRWCSVRWWQIFEQARRMKSAESGSGIGRTWWLASVKQSGKGSFRNQVDDHWEYIQRLLFSFLFWCVSGTFASAKLSREFCFLVLEFSDKFIETSTTGVSNSAKNNSEHSSNLCVPVSWRMVRHRTSHWHCHLS